jgi:hypothetical protein
MFGRISHVPPKLVSISISTTTLILSSSRYAHSYCSRLALPTRAPSEKTASFRIGRSPSSTCVERADDPLFHGYLRSLSYF